MRELLFLFLELYLSFFNLLVLFIALYLLLIILNISRFGDSESSAWLDESGHVKRKRSIIGKWLAD